jgi:hypothetical protein
VTNSEGEIILSTEPRWRGRTEEEALDLQPAPSAIERAIEATADWAFGDPSASSSGRGGDAAGGAHPVPRLAHRQPSPPMPPCASG